MLCKPLWDEVKQKDKHRSFQYSVQSYQFPVYFLRAALMKLVNAKVIFSNAKIYIYGLYMADGFMLLGSARCS